MHDTHNTSPRFTQFKAHPTSLKKILQTGWNFLLELVFPKFCLGCQREGAFLCPKCRATIPIQQTQVCPRCYQQNGRALHAHQQEAGRERKSDQHQPDAGLICEPCRSPDFELDGLFTVSSFEKQSLLQRCIHTFKYEFIEELATPLGQLLATTLQQWRTLQDIDVICPVPLHPRRMRFRGFNQAELLAQKMLQFSLQSKRFVPLLQRTHFYRPQMELTREERLRNVENAFALVEDFNAPTLIKGSKILLIDDVATTLSTLNNCAKVLKKAGANKVYGLVLARVY